ncbi:MAG: agmatinase family protein [Haliscomenobacter sp.]
MTKAEVIASFDPNGVGLRNGHFIGLPFTEDTAELILLSIPWDVTVSYRAGTSTGPANILQASVQLDLFDPDVEAAWKLGIYFQPPAADIAARNDALRPIAEQYIEFLENGGELAASPFFQRAREEINHACAELKERIRASALKVLQQGKLLGLVGGDHSTPLGFLEALAETYPSFGVLHIDAHMDLREAYEGFRYSHASIFFNALKLEALTQLTQVGIRDFCAEEWEQAQSQGKRMAVFFDQDLCEGRFQGKTWHEQCLDIIATLPENVYISFDVDGLDPSLCPHTGTPVPGGLSLGEALYLIKQVALSGRKIIGFDLNETAGLGHEWDGNVGARVLYKLCNWMGRTQGRI